MKRTAVGALLAAVVFGAAAGMLRAAEAPGKAEPLALSGQVDAVTVYRGQALVTRVVDLPAGGRRLLQTPARSADTHLRAVPLNPKP